MYWEILPPRPERFPKISALGKSPGLGGEIANALDSGVVMPRILHEVETFITKFPCVATKIVYKQADNSN